MKNNSRTILVFVLLVLAASAYRVWDNRPAGFAPQIAMALFAGSVIRDKRFSFLIPLFSMLLSDVLYQVLYSQGLTEIKGFYQGQLPIYVLFTLVTVIGFLVKKNNISSILLGSLTGVLFFYVASNFLVWMGGGLDINNQPYPKTFEGLRDCLVAGLPFLRGSLYATLLFSALFFGCYHVYNRYITRSPEPLKAW